jgi:hypothetical protein
MIDRSMSRKAIGNRAGAGDSVFFPFVCSLKVLLFFFLSSTFLVLNLCAAMGLVDYLALETRVDFLEYSV